MKLSVREHAVWNLVVLGYSDKEIGIKLNIAYGTVRTYIDRGILKLNARNRVNAAVIFYVLSGMNLNQ
ncbi:helix-turn-helix transcriptional regulator [bacterium]|nr:helix-turn-helix transcriptional regulator [bacterium]